MAKWPVVSGSVIVAVLVCWAVVPVEAASAPPSPVKTEEWAVPADAGKVFEGEYIHRVGGRDYLRVKMTKSVAADQTAYFEVTGLSDRDCLLTLDARGRPVSYKSRSVAKGYLDSYQFIGDKSVHATWGSRDPFDWDVRAGALPDLNSRPDPYLIQYVLLQAYDLGKRGEQTFTVYDVDAAGKGINHYEVTLELVDEDGVLLPNGRCKARHFLQVQRTESNTWFKKFPGHKTEYWVDDNGILLRVYRHREPYEVILRAHEAAEPLASSTYEHDLAAFFDEMDRTYPFFELKGIQPDWDNLKGRLREGVKTCRSDEQFLGIVREAILCLHDSHMTLTGTRVSPPPWSVRYYPGISFVPATNGRVVVMWCRDGLDPALAVGTVVTKIDARDARSYLEEEAKKVWAEGGMSGQQRARFHAYRLPLQTDQKGRKHIITVLTDEGERRVELACDFDARSGFPHWYNRPEGLKQARSCAYARLAGGAGYVYLRRIDETTTAGLKEALSAHADAKGWIIDLRGNSGGGYGQDLLEVLKGLPRPVAAIIDAGCISAGETLARDLVQLADARLFGSTTAGASTAKRDWTFPSGVATVSCPVRSRWGPGGQLIEFHGVQPHVEVEAVPEDLRRGLNTEILKAEEYLRSAPAAKESTSL